MINKKLPSMIQIREFGLLLNGGDKSDIDCHSITPSAFNWLLSNGQSSNEKSVELVRIKKYGKGIALQVVNYVGVLETPCGTRIEILPKISDSDESDIIKKILIKMLTTVNKLSLQQFEDSSLQTLKQPLFEILIGYFLHEIASIIKKGVRSDYNRMEERKSYLKGQLNTSKQIRQRPGYQNRFYVSYDKFTSNRPENRLIHTALKQVLSWVKSSENLQLAKELLFALSDVPLSANYENDLKRWSKDRSLVHYREAKPWCELILSYQSPLVTSGSYRGISFLFPMEVLFEKYVAERLKKAVLPDLRLNIQVSSHALVEHRSARINKTEGWFKLRPDIVVKDVASDKVVFVADTKWKRIDERLDTAKHKYGISQSDMYQLLAYGNSYLGGCGTMYLIYPKQNKFTNPLPPFNYSAELRVIAIPYDLLTDDCEIVHLI
ncbi:restriction endonuclease [Vibrio albus]|uniref:Restriction endonuclease n=1 Tax=Vibrio albus TaxID=2200953 RepID=A0A2U3B9S2_9VIBR|nr:McrC family protein [Vibrio albus]PWI33538.1 restriction endonuclease [Vibrio albus]